MQYTIIVPFDNSADDKKIVECCRRHGVSAVAGKIRAQKVYTLTTEDVTNFYWLGMNIQQSIYSEK